VSRAHHHLVLDISRFGRFGWN